MTVDDPGGPGGSGGVGAPRTHPRYTLDEVIHSPVRLSIMATLYRVGEIDFAALRDVVEVSDSLLSKHVRLLEDRGYVHVAKGYLARRPRTWFSLTDSGRGAFTQYRTTLSAIIGQEETAPAS